MMPFTTYIIPETDKKKTAQTPKWLWMVTDQAILPAQEELLQKISQSIKADFEKDAHVLVCPASESMSLSGLNPDQTTLIISFGVLPSQLGLWIDLTKPGIRFLEPYSFILTGKLDEMNRLPEMKKNLWSMMQAHFQHIQNRLGK